MIPVTLLTGFLGSGKTTLLQRMLGDPAMAGTAVLINEYGEVALDHHLLERIDETVMLMKSGCICCTVRGEVAQSILDLIALRGQGRAAFDRIVIETTGLADPWPVLSTLRAHPVLQSQVRAGGVITTVDAVNAPAMLSGSTRREALRQIAAADVLALTKTDLAPAPGLPLQLAALNPTARMLDARTDPVAEIALAAREGRQVPPLETHHDHGAGMTSTTMVFEEEIDWTAFGVWLTLLLNRHGDRILRVKGILNLKGEERPVAIHGVQRLVHPPHHMTDWPDQDRRSRLVFIMEGIEPSLLRRSFDLFQKIGQRQETTS